MKLPERAFPTCLLSSTAKPSEAPRVNIDFAKRIAGDVTLKVWEGLGHELHTEVQKDEVLAFVTGWLNARWEAFRGRPGSGGC